MVELARLPAMGAEREGIEAALAPQLIQYVQIRPHVVDVVAIWRILVRGP